MPVTIFGPECRNIRDLMGEYRRPRIHRRQGGTAGTLHAVRRARVAVDELWEKDQDAYAESYTPTARRTLADRGAVVDIEEVTYPPGTALTDPESGAMVNELHEVAREHAPLPMTGQAPYWSRGTPADALRREGLTYTVRAAQTAAGKAD